MKKGCVATVIIPSKIGYGAEGKGDIQPYSTLIFEIEIVDVRR
jgi:FKBP-type peptidyl-prolyl cis-trans isomerase